MTLIAAAVVNATAATVAATAAEPGHARAAGDVSGATARGWADHVLLSAGESRYPLSIPTLVVVRGRHPAV